MSYSPSFGEESKSKGYWKRRRKLRPETSLPFDSFGLKDQVLPKDWSSESKQGYAPFAGEAFVELNSRITRKLSRNDKNISTGFSNDNSTMVDVKKDLTVDLKTLEADPPNTMLAGLSRTVRPRLTKSIGVQVPHDK